MEAETYCKLEDLTKNILFNTNDDRQEENARNLMKSLKKLQANIEVGRCKK